MKRMLSRSVALAGLLVAVVDRSRPVPAILAVTTAFGLGLYVGTAPSAQPVASRQIADGDVVDGARDECWWQSDRFLECEAVLQRFGRACLPLFDERVDGSRRKCLAEVDGLRAVVGSVATSNFLTGTRSMLAVSEGDGFHEEACGGEEGEMAGASD